MSEDEDVPGLSREMRRQLASYGYAIDDDAALQRVVQRARTPEDRAALERILTLFIADDLIVIPNDAQSEELMNELRKAFRYDRNRDTRLK